MKIHLLLFALCPLAILGQTAPTTIPVSLAWDPATNVTAGTVYLIKWKPIAAPNWTATNNAGAVLAYTLTVPNVENAFICVALANNAESLPSNSVTNKVVPPTPLPGSPVLLRITGGTLTGTIESAPTKQEQMDMIDGLLKEWLKLHPQFPTADSIRQSGPAGTYQLPK